MRSNRGFSDRWLWRASCAASAVSGASAGRLRRRRSQPGSRTSPPHVCGSPGISLSSPRGRVHATSERRPRQQAVLAGPGPAAVPGVPALDLDPPAHAAAVALGVRLAGVVLGDPVNVLQVRVVLERDAAVERDVAVPLVAVEDGERDARLLPEV